MEQCYSDANFPRRQIHVIRKDVRFTMKGMRSNNRNYSLSNSHARIAFEKKVQVGKDQEKAQSEKDFHSKNRGGKKKN